MKMKNYIIEQESNGRLVFNDDTMQYEGSALQDLDNDIERLEWEIYSDTKDLERLKARRRRLEDAL